MLTHWGRVTHICVSKLTSIVSDNSLSTGRRQAIIWNNAGILLIGPLETNFSEISIEIQIFNLKKIRLKMSSAKCRPFCLGLNVLRLEYLPEKRLDVSHVWYDSFITLKHKLSWSWTWCYYTETEMFLLQNCVICITGSCHLEPVTGPSHNGMITYCQSSS